MNRQDGARGSGQSTATEGTANGCGHLSRVTEAVWDGGAG